MLCEYWSEFTTKITNPEKWDFLRITLEWFANYVKQKLKAPWKTVLEKCGFLVCCTLKYSFLTTDLKGIHISVEAYHPNKDNDGWERKLLQQEPDPINTFAFE